MEKLKQFWHKDGTRSVMASLLSILIGLAAGSVLILIVGLCTPAMGPKTAWEGIRLIFLGLFSTGRNAATGALTFGFNPANMGNLLFRATPVILTGLSVAVAYKTGLFNIGAPGQYLAGTTVTLLIALYMPTGVGELYAWRLAQGFPVPAVLFPTWFVWVCAFLGGVLAGALWGAIPGLLKSLLNIIANHDEEAAEILKDEGMLNVKIGDDEDVESE
jgi:simple sugar transport system permease protein